MFLAHARTHARTHTHIQDFHLNVMDHFQMWNIFWAILDNWLSTARTGVFKAEAKYGLFPLKNTAVFCRQQLQRCILCSFTYCWYSWAAGKQKLSQIHMLQHKAPAEKKKQQQTASKKTVTVTISFSCFSVKVNRKGGITRRRVNRNNNKKREKNREKE